MDTAYDRVQAETLPAETQESAPGAAPAQNLNSEIQEAFRAVSASPWGASLGSFFGQVRRQGESLYHDIQKEASEASKEASKGLSSFRDSVVAAATSASSTTTTAEGQGEEGGDLQKKSAEDGSERPASPTADIVREASSLVASLRSTAAARLKDLQKAEDAADDALLKFGLNVREFLRDAVKITAPGEDDENGSSREVLFEATDSSGKKVFHSTRLEAQLHAIHASSAKFTRDPASGEAWRAWEASFDIAARKPRIAEDLARHEELRRAYEWAVPERADYKNFWMRYYFLRQAVDEEERRRKEVLKGAAGETEEEVGWDDDEEEEEDDEREKSTEDKAVLGSGHKASESTTTLSGAPNIADSDLLKPSDSRRSEDEQRSVADSDASYDMMTASGATSRVAGSPQLEPTKHVPTAGGKNDDDEEDDWE